MLNNVSSPGFGRLMIDMNAKLEQPTSGRINTLAQLKQIGPEIYPVIQRIEDAGADIYMKDIPEENTIEFCLRKTVKPMYYNKELKGNALLSRAYYSQVGIENKEKYGDPQPLKYTKDGCQITWQDKWDSNKPDIENYARMFTKIGKLADYIEG